MAANNLNIFIDFGGVLYEINVRRTIDAMAAFSALDAEALAGMANDSIFSEYERGEIGTSQFRSRAKELFRLECTDGSFEGKFEAAWNSTLVAKYSDAEENVLKLKQFGRIFLLSNTNDLHLSKFRPECARLFSLFDGLFFSHELGLAKPDPRIYEHVLHQTASPAHQSIFIDDIAANVSAAEACGIRSFLVGPGKLSDILHSVQLYAQQS